MPGEKKCNKKNKIEANRKGELSTLQLLQPDA